jgi:hypothetical protein
VAALIDGAAAGNAKHSAGVTTIATPATRAATTM